MAINAPSAITKNGAGANPPTYGISDRADYCVEELENTVINWTESISGIDSIMEAYLDFATDKSKQGPTTSVTIGAYTANIPDLSSPTDFKRFKAGWESAFDNFTNKRADVNTAAYAIIDEIFRIKGVLKTYRDLFWAEETAVNAELKRLETIRDQYAARRDYWYGQRDYYQGLLDGLNPLDPDYTANLTSYTSLRNTASSNASHHDTDRETTEGYRSTVLTQCNAIFGDFAGGANTGQEEPAATAVNGEYETILNTIRLQLLAVENKTGTKGKEATYWDGKGHTYPTTYEGTEYDDTPVALLEYMGKFQLVTLNKDSVAKMGENTFEIGEFQTVNNDLVAFDLTTTTTSYTTTEGFTNYVHYPQLNSSPDAKESLLKAFLNTGTSAKYWNDRQHTLSSMNTQVSTVKTQAESSKTAIAALALSSQTNDWDTDLDNLETARTQYSFWVYDSAP